MKLCITEKPSVAKDIAAIIGATTRRDGYYEGGDYKVTWTYGHLCTLKEPADYTDAWKRWSLSQLPMVPVRFGIKVIDQESIERQFTVIKNLIAEASEVINCGDAGQEGELIQRWVMQKADIKCPVKRLWISSLTDESIREGFSKLEPDSRFNNLYHAGLSRAIGDWLLGMNATRLYTLKYSKPGNVLSIGRVQTPTLALIVQRHHEIANFKPEDFWELKTTYRDVTFNGQGKRYKNEGEVEGIISRIKDEPFTVTKVEEKKGKEFPPKLFDLTSLQVECNKRWGWSAEETLRLIQSLYEKKVTTYPRVDTTYLSTDLYRKIPTTLRQMTPYSNLTTPLLNKKIPMTKRIFDNAKVTDHHAIIPTGQAPTALVGDERKLYHLIALRFISAFYPDCTFLQTTVIGQAGGVEFKATGKVITSAGWRDVAEGGGKNEKETDDTAGDDKILPPFTVGESGSHIPSIVKKTTQPPKFYTEGTLLRAMESAGKMVDDEELREAMKENGIGRPSTRAAIIETLFKRRYIYRERKNIMASPAGIDLIATINQELLKSAKLTGIWENKLRRIERGEYSGAEFINELKQQISEIVYNVLNDTSLHRIETNQEEPVEPDQKAKKRKKLESGTDAEKPKRKPRRKTEPITMIEEIMCPICKKGHLIKGRTAFGCSRYGEGCTSTWKFEEFPADTAPDKLAKLVIKSSK
ncbi:MAG: DNA topoisomerase 3 [Muribaculaceae bacterium]|nr:DNA topoisomerase 3 [Muribaculaceae bacterium]